MKRLYRLSRSTVWRMTKDPTFPTPICVGRSVRWVQSEIEEWLLTRKAPTRRAGHNRPRRSTGNFPTVVLVPA